MKIRNVVLTCVACGCLLFAKFGTVSAQEEYVDIAKQPRVTCINGCSFLSVLICGHNWDFDGISTHGSCTITWYTCNYTGYLCTSCGNMQSMASLNAGNGLHYCHQLHGNCGRGDTGSCQGSTVGV